jgi:hypothetical protein
MRLFELFEADLSVGMANLNKIAQAAKNNTQAEIMLGGEPTTLTYPEARFVYGIYKRAAAAGQAQDFMRELSDPGQFDNIMRMQRDIIYRNRSGDEAQATARRLGESVKEARDDDEDWWGLKDKTAGKDKDAGITRHRGTYGTEYQGDEGDDDDYDQWGNLKPKAKEQRAAAKSAKAAAAPKLGRGRPTANIKKTDGGIEIHSYNSWYNKTKRTHPERKIIGSADRAVAIVVQGNKNLVAGEWSGSKGTVADKLTKSIASDKLKTDYKSAKGRPRKVREWIETLAYIAEAKNHMGETEYTTYSAWRAACRRAGADEFDGDKDICQAKKSGKGVGEWDGAVGTVYDDAHKKAKQ